MRIFYYRSILGQGTPKRVESLQRARWLNTIAGRRSPRMFLDLSLGRHQQLTIMAT